MLSEETVGREKAKVVLDAKGIVGEAVAQFSDIKDSQYTKTLSTQAETIAKALWEEYKKPFVGEPAEEVLSSAMGGGEVIEQEINPRTSANDFLLQMINYCEFNNPAGPEVAKSGGAYNTLTQEVCNHLAINLLTHGQFVYPKLLTKVYKYANAELYNTHYAQHKSDDLLKKGRQSTETQNILALVRLLCIKFGDRYLNREHQLDTADANYFKTTVSSKLKKSKKDLMREYLQDIIKVYKAYDATEAQKFAISLLSSGVTFTVKNEFDDDNTQTIPRPLGLVFNTHMGAKGGMFRSNKPTDTHRDLRDFVQATFELGEDFLANIAGLPDKTETFNMK